MSNGCSCVKSRRVCGRNFHLLAFGENLHGSSRPAGSANRGTFSAARQCANECS